MKTALEILNRNLTKDSTGVNLTQTDRIIHAMYEFAEQKIQADAAISVSAIKIVKDLAEWSKKYPRGRVYPMNKMSMDNELIKLEERAGELSSQLLVLGLQSVGEG